MEEIDLEKKVQEHDDKFREVDLELERHREQIEQLNANDESFNEKFTTLSEDLTKVQKGQSDVQLTVMKGNEDNRAMLEKNTELTNKLLDHVLGKDAQEFQADIENKKQKWEIIGKIAVGLVGTGGLIALIIQAFIS